MEQKLARSVSIIVQALPQRYFDDPIYEVILLQGPVFGGLKLVVLHINVRMLS